MGEFDFDALTRIATESEGRIVLHSIEQALTENGTLLSGVWRSVCATEGNCYPVAACVGLAAERAGYKAFVVHGKPTLQVAPFMPYDHAWVEVETRMGNMAIDLSNGCNAALPVKRYYELGAVKIEEDAAVYTPDEVWQLITNSGHYGPFHIPVNAGQEKADGQT